MSNSLYSLFALFIGGLCFVLGLYEAGHIWTAASVIIGRIKD